MGFSQGARMVLQLLRDAPGQFRYAFALSGSVAPGDHAGDAALAAAHPRVPVFWAHGDDDRVIASASVDRTRQWLAGHAAPEEHSYSMGHTINQAELADMKEFVARH
jgi:phospholipase/carboxylesterase